MSKQIMKPVWRVNSGNGTPSDSKEYPVILFGDGDLSLGNTHFSEWGWVLDRRMGAAYRITAYETNRTKAAKYERKRCRTCYGKGRVNISRLKPKTFSCAELITNQPERPSLEYYETIEKCHRCNGKGYKLEAVK